MGVRAIWISVFLFPLVCLPARAGESDERDLSESGDESGWVQPPLEPEPELDTRPMLTGAHLLAPGDVGLRASGGVMYVSGGVQVGVLDRLELMAESTFPYRDLGNTWMLGGGTRIRIYQRGIFAYAVTLRLYGIFYDEVNPEVERLPEGLALWPSFAVGLRIKEGSFFADVGTLFWPYTSAGSTERYAFAGLPARFGGEIALTDQIHFFLNVDLVVSGYFGIFAPALTGPFNLIEAGVAYIL